MNVSYTYWPDTVACACHIMNKTSSKTLNRKNPLQIIKNIKAGINHLRVFGCTYFVHLQEHKKNKLKARAIKYIFLGYPDGKKVYKFYDPVNKKLYFPKMLNS